jgi:excisionase family DNA binding protein
MPFPRRWISPKEAGVYLSLHPQTIYQLIYEGKLPAARVGGSVRIDLTKLNAFLEGQAAPDGIHNGRTR